MNSLTPKYGAVVTTVDPSQGLIEVALKSGDLRRIGSYTTPVAWRWPQVGDEVMVRQENGSWILDGWFLDSTAASSVQSIQPGDASLTAPTGIVHVIGSTTGATDFTITSQGMASQLTTALSLTPIDGQEVSLQADTFNDGVVWRFRYRAGSPSSYRWEFIGGSPIESLSTLNSSGYATTRASVNNTPGFTVPRAGEYVIRWGAYTIGNSGTFATTTDYYLGVWDFNTHVTYGYDLFTTATAAYGGGAVSGEQVATLPVNALITLSCYFGIGAQGMRISQPWISATPRRIS